MNILTDIHCHTIASTHAYSTVVELAHTAAQKGMQAIAITDHGVAIPDSPHLWHFENLKTIPREIEGVTILRGVEANIVSDSGEIDMSEHILKRMDIVVASIHGVCYGGTHGKDDYTDTYLGVLDNPYVDVLGHSGTFDFPYNHEDVVLKAKEQHKLIEINAHSHVARRRSIENCRNIALKCKEIGAGICVNSDAHICFEVGDYTPAIEMLREIEFPEELIMNRSLETLKAYLAPRKELNI